MDLICIADLPVYGQEILLVEEWRFTKKMWTHDVGCIHVYLL
jgi:hypothetical protein